MSIIELPIEVVTLYGHLSKFIIPTEGSKWVERGEIIGLSGATGDTDFPHLHLSIYQNWMKGYNGGHMNLHLFWADGEGKITCFDPTIRYRKDKFIITYPVKCRK